MNIMNETLPYTPVLRKHLNSLLSNGIGFLWLSTPFHGKRAKEIELLSRWYTNCTGEQKPKGKDDFHGICKNMNSQDIIPRTGLESLFRTSSAISIAVSYFQRYLTRDQQRIWRQIQYWWNESQLNSFIKTPISPVEKTVLNVQVLLSLRGGGHKVLLISLPPCCGKKLPSYLCSTLCNICKAALRNYRSYLLASFIYLLQLKNALRASLEPIWPPLAISPAEQGRE